MKEWWESERRASISTFNSWVYATHNYSEIKDTYGIIGEYASSIFDVLGVTTWVKDGLEHFAESFGGRHFFTFLKLYWESMVYILKDAKPIPIE